MHLKLNPNETLLYFDQNSSKGKKVLAYAQSRRKKVREMDWGKNKFTTTFWKGVLNKLGKSPKELLDKSKPYYQEHLRGKDFNDEDWLNILSKTPELLRGPIIIEGQNAILCDNANDIFKF